MITDAPSWMGDQELPLLCSTELTRNTPEGVVLGFGLQELDEAALVPSLVRSVHFLKQVHGDDLIIAPNAENGVQAGVAGDGWIIQTDRFVGSALAFAIRTADCLPAFFVGDQFIALVHAGWRGLQQAILLKTLQTFRTLHDWPRFVSLGPAADPACYEVGEEFFSIFPESSAVRREGEKILFNMYAEALFQLDKGNYRGEVECSPIFTISDPRFYSHRRDRAGKGRNFSLALFGAE